MARHIAGPPGPLLVADPPVPSPRRTARSAETLPPAEPRRTVRRADDRMTDVAGPRRVAPKLEPTGEPMPWARHANEAGHRRRWPLALSIAVGLVVLTSGTGSPTS